MKKIWLMVIALVMTTSVAWADIFNLEAPLKYTQEKQADGSYVITLSGNLCIPDGVLYVYHQDNMRGRNVRKYRAEPVTFTDDLKQWIVTPFTTEVGQVMYNLYSPTLNRWMGIPTCMLTLGEGLAYGNSYFDASVEHEGAWDRPGGVGIIITAAGIPVQYPVSINCDQGQLPAPRPVASPPVRIVTPAPAKKSAPAKPCTTCDGSAAVIGDKTMGSAVAEDAQGITVNTKAVTKGHVSPIIQTDNKKVSSKQAKGHTMRVKGNGVIDNKFANQPVTINQYGGGDLSDGVDFKQTLSPREFQRIHRNPDNTHRTDCGTCHNDFRKASLNRWEDFAYKNASTAATEYQRNLRHKNDKYINGKGKDPFADKFKR